MSIDGFGAGPNQGFDNPLGVGGEGLHQWFFPTRVFQKIQGKDDGTTGGYKRTEHVTSPDAMHVVLTK